MVGCDRPLMLGLDLVPFLVEVHHSRIVGVTRKKSIGTALHRIVARNRVVTVAPSAVAIIVIVVAVDPSPMITVVLVMPVMRHRSDRHCQHHYRCSDEHQRNHSIETLLEVHFGLPPAVPSSDLTGAWVMPAGCTV